MDALLAAWPPNVHYMSVAQGASQEGKERLREAAHGLLHSVVNILSSEYDGKALEGTLVQVRRASQTGGRVTARPTQPDAHGSGPAGVQRRGFVTEECDGRLRAAGILLAHCVCRVHLCSVLLRSPVAHGRAAAIVVLGVKH